MTHRFLGSIAAAASAAAVLAALSACSSDSAAPDLGTAGVTGPGVASSGSPTHITPPRSPGTRSHDPSHASGPRGGSFAERAGIPPRRVTDASAKIDVEDQSGDGNTIRISEVRITRGAGHVAIFTDSGTLLGSAPVGSAVTPSTVRLDTKVPASGELIAVLFADDGDGVFDLTRDPAINGGDHGSDDRLDLEDEDFSYVLR